MLGPASSNLFQKAIFLRTAVDVGNSTSKKTKVSALNSASRQRSCYLIGAMPGIDLSLSRTLKTEQPAYQDAELKVGSCGVITSVNALHVTRAARCIQSQGS